MSVIMGAQPGPTTTAGARRPDAGPAVVPYGAGVTADRRSGLRAAPADGVRSARFAELTADELYVLLRLRVDVFVVEQHCPYPELDDRDREPGTEHVWTEDGAGPTAYLRTLRDPGALRIGRVCTRADARGAGTAARLVAHVLDRHPDVTAVLDAQTYLVPFYERFGFRVSGPEFVEDGIPHVPMRRAGSAGAG
jgi:ElaA protein